MRLELSKVRRLAALVNENDINKIIKFVSLNIISIKALFMGYSRRYKMQECDIIKARCRRSS